MLCCERQSKHANDVKKRSRVSIRTYYLEERGVSHEEAELHDEAERCESRRSTDVFYTKKPIGSVAQLVRAHP